MTHLATLAAPQANSLSVLLELGDELVALLHHIDVLLVLVIWAIRLDDFVDTINCARDAIHGDEVAEIPEDIVSHSLRHRYCWKHSLVQEVNANTKIARHASQPHNAV